MLDIFVFTECDHINYEINKNISIAFGPKGPRANTGLLCYWITRIIFIREKTKYFDLGVFHIKSYPIKEFNNKMINVKRVFTPIIIGDTIGQGVAEYFKLIENKLDVEYKRFNINSDKVNRTILSIKILWPGYKGFTQFEFDN